ncbi:uncharacterized protein [Ptychodera flava]|uniref:uncharacterized protein n=1 Tax=Ptychodera flava TaxID=63121 RepID=UPI003969D660
MNEDRVLVVPVRAVICLHLLFYGCFHFTSGVMSKSLCHSRVGQNATLQCSNCTYSVEYKIETVRWGRGLSDSFVGQKYLSGREEYMNKEKYLIEEISSLTIFDSHTEDSDVYDYHVIFRLGKQKIVCTGSVELIVEDNGHKNNMLQLALVPERGAPLSHADYDRVDNMPQVVKESDPVPLSQTGSSSKETLTISQKYVIIGVSVGISLLLAIAIIAVILKRRGKKREDFEKEGDSDQANNNATDKFLKEHDRR